jgi:hypothetical protein
VTHTDSGGKDGEDHSSRPAPQKHDTLPKKYTKQKRDGALAQVVEQLRTKCEALSSNLRSTKKKLPLSNLSFEFIPKHQHPCLHQTRHLTLSFLVSYLFSFLNIPLSPSSVGATAKSAFIEMTSFMANSNTPLL